jgi:hypothetical protein
LFDDHSANIVRGSAAQRFENRGRRSGIRLSFLPAFGELAGPFQILAARHVGRSVSLRGILAFVLQQGVSERAQDGFRVPPADGVQRAEGIGDENGFMADVAKIAAAVFREDLEAFVAAGNAGQPGHGGVGGRLVPVVHRIDERFFGLSSGRDFQLIRRGHAPTAFFLIGGLR